MIKKLLLFMGAILVIVVSYRVLTLVVEWLRIKAGVASDTGTPIDVLAWLGCIFAASVIAGNLAQALARATGILGLVAMLLSLGVLLITHLRDSLILDGFATALGALDIVVLAWAVSVGLALGWALSTVGRNNSTLWPACMVFMGALVTLVIVFYPVERYFMSTFGGG